MATHSSILAWRIPGTVETHGLPSMGLHRVGHECSDLAAAAAAAAALVSAVPQHKSAICYLIEFYIQQIGGGFWGWQFHQLLRPTQIFLYLTIGIWLCLPLFLPI